MLALDFSTLPPLNGNGQQPVALLSVYNKTGLIPFAQRLVEEHGYRLLATGGTYKVLKAAGLVVEELSTLTGFEALLKGRVKSLHPRVFAGILAPTPFLEAAEHNVEAMGFLPISLVCVNLYPFEAAANDEAQANDADAMAELIDIGGVSLLRAAAKNYNRVWVASCPSQYEDILAQLDANTPTQHHLGQRQALALKAFKRCSEYDTAITRWFESRMSEEASGLDATSPLALQSPVDTMPETLTLKLKQVETLRYGENPHQPAALYTPHGQALQEVLLHGKPLSFNNWMDLEAAWASLCEFPNETAAVIVKHAQPCGVAVAPTPLEAFTQALDCDPVSVFGGVVAFNEPVEAPVAKLLHSLFLEVIVAPAFSEEALAILSAKKNVRLVTRPWPTGDVLPASRYNGHTLRQLSPHLFLAQAKHHGHTELLLAEHMKIVTKAKPTHAQLQQMAFAWRVVKHVGSNAIVVANGEAPCSPDAPADTLYTVGLCGGRPSRVGAVEIALQQACDKATGSVLASDAFFPAIDSVELAAQHNVSAIIQPGGSIKDEAVIEACNRFGIAMVFTGVREFKH